MQADMVLNKELRVLHLDSQTAERDRDRDNRQTQAWLEHLKPESPPSATHFPQQATPTPTKPHILIMPLPLGAVFFQTTTNAKLAEKGLGYRISP